jgi:hypothetical protein
MLTLALVGVVLAPLLDNTVTLVWLRSTGPDWIPAALAAFAMVSAARTTACAVVVFVIAPAFNAAPPVGERG